MTKQRRKKIEKEMRKAMRKGGPCSNQELGRRNRAYLEGLSREDRQIAISILVDAGVMERVTDIPEDAP